MKGKFSWKNRMENFFKSIIQLNKLNSLGYISMIYSYIFIVYNFEKRFACLSTMKGKFPGKNRMENLDKSII